MATAATSPDFVMHHSPPEDDFLLAEADVRELVRLLGEVCALPDDHTGKKRSLMDGLRELIAADCWVWCLVAEPRTDEPPVLVSFSHGGFTEERFAHFLEASQHPGSARNTAGIVSAVRAAGSQQTRLREQLIPTEEFLASSAYPAWCAADVSGVLLSVRPVDSIRQSAIGFYRGMGKPPFTAREARLAHVIISEVPWLHEQGWPEDRAVTVPQLSLRQRLVLNLLLDGRDRASIAEILRVSPHTANDYVKAVYRHFGIHSQAALIARFFRGDGGDKG
jgi:DNA-binding CsgD family transcriptional regulator